MSIIAQCGYAEGEKVVSALSAGIVDGVILSPRHHSVVDLRAQAEVAAGYGNAKYVLFDSQFYASVVASGVARLGKLQAYPYYPSQQGLRRVHFTPSQARTFTRDVLDFQAKQLGSFLSHYIAPTVLLDSLDDFWSQIALDLASEAIEHNKNLKPSKPLLISLFARESAFSDRKSVEDFVDAITSYDVAGFYIVIHRSLSRSEYALKPGPLGHLMYTFYVLGNVNEYTVISGYEDLEGVLLHASGVAATACGWSRGIQAFNLENLYVQTGPPGGTSPRARYTSGPLLSTLKFFPEIRDIDKAGKLSRILSGGVLDASLKNALARNLSSWDRRTEAHQHWQTLSSLVARITQHPTTKERVKIAADLLSDAIKCHNELQSVTIKNRTVRLKDAHLIKWADALKVFQDVANL